ncbi:MAG: PQQ-binding-like beta-propeller repeat protein [Tepidisphaeraceae bacterium]
MTQTTTPLIRHRSPRVVMHLTGFAGAALIALGVAGCNHHDAGSPQRSGQAVALEAKSFGRYWEADLGLKGSRVNEMHLRDDLVFVYTDDNVSHVLQRSGGQVAHIDPVRSGGDLRGPVVLKDAIVYPTNTTLAIYDPRGSKRRTLDMSAALRSGAVGVNDNVYFGIDDPGGGRLVQVDLNRAHEPAAWRLQTRGGVSATPALHDDIVYAGSEDGSVYAVNEDRSAVWPLENGVFRTGGRIVADLKADDYAVYVASGDSKLYALHRISGKVRWQYFAGRALTVSPQLSPDFVYQFVPGQGIVAINKTEGEYNRQPAWTFRDATQFLASDEQYAYLAGKDRRIVAIEKKTGKPAFTSQRKFDHFVSNAKGDGIIYAATNGGQVVAIKPVLVGGQTGEVVLVFDNLTPRG